MTTTRVYTDADRDALLSIWERGLPLDGISTDEFERRVLLDANLEPEGLIVAEDGNGKLTGFVICVILRHPIEKTGMMEHRGFITAMAVDPQHQRAGVGAALLARATEFCRARNRREIAIAPYTPNYFVPGVDKERYRHGVAFLQKNGFQEIVEAIAMDAMIGQFELDPELVERERALRTEGITIESFHRGRLREYMAFMNEHMPGPWVEDARRNLKELTFGRFPEDGIQLACHEGRIIGYCQFEGQHFGPFGVVDGYQGRGVGTVLLARTLYRMRLHGNHAAFVLWTGERAAAGVYARLGFRITRRFSIMRKVLD